MQLFGKRAEPVCVTSQIGADGNSIDQATSHVSVCVQLCCVIVLVDFQRNVKRRHSSDLAGVGCYG